jgi:acyl-coenzyme A thioesterase PaaI-like protein
MTDDAGRQAESMNGTLESAIPIAHKMGVRVVEARRGYAAATVPVEGNGNHFGVIYAGVQFTLAEILGGIIALSTFDPAKYFPLVKNVDIKFVSMARSELRAKPSWMRRRLRVSRPKQPDKARPTSRPRRSLPTPTVRQSPAPAACTSSVPSAADDLIGYRSTLVRRGNFQPGRT